jgi:hypothetical protein
LEENTFFGSHNSQIPQELLIKEGNDLFWLGTLLAFSFVMLASVRLNNGKSYDYLIRLFNSATHVDERLKETYRLESYVNVGFLLNFLSALFICLYLGFIQLMQLDFWISLGISTAIVFWIFLMQSLPPRIIGWVTGEKLPQTTMLANTFVGFHFFGLLYAFLALIWFLNPQYNEIFGLILFILFAVMNLVRVFKNTIVVISAGISWYYIILYFCTLEILPLFVVYHYVQLNFSIDF